MAIILNCDDLSSIGLDDLTQSLEHDFKMQEDEHLVECAPLLRRLGNNRTFLSFFIASQLQKGAPVASTLSRFPEPALELYNGKDFLVRAVFWFPPSMFPLSRRWQAQSLSYLNAHDHEHSFLTIGYYGPGYVTRLFEYDPTSVRGVPGEHVELNERASQSVSEGKMMVYQESSDVHIQSHPEEFSITLNVALKVRHYRKPQTIFDLNTNAITSTVTSEKTYYDSLLRIARYLESSSMTSAVERLAQTHPENAVKIGAWKHLADADPGNTEYYLRSLTAIGTPEARSAVLELSSYAEGRVS